MGLNNTPDNSPTIQLLLDDQDDEEESNTIPEKTFEDHDDQCHIESNIDHLNTMIHGNI